MSNKSQTPKAQLERSVQGTMYENVTIHKVGRDQFEIWWNRFNYLCLLTYVNGKWGATHNMAPNEQTPMYDSAVTAIRNYHLGAY